MNPLPSRPTIAERLAAFESLAITAAAQLTVARARLDELEETLRQIGDAAQAGEPRPPRYLTAEEAARHVAARLGATGDGDDDGPLFDGPVTTKAELDEAYERAAPAEVCMMAGCGHAEELHSLALDTGNRLFCTGFAEDGSGICPCRRYLSAQAMRIAPGGSAGPASLASVEVQADGSVTAAPPAQFPACACGDPADAHADTAGTRRAPCFRPERTCPDYEIPADREHEILPAASTA